MDEAPYSPPIRADRILGGLALLVLLTAYIASASTLRCTFVDNNGAPLKGVEVRLTQLNDGGRTVGDSWHRNSDKQGSIEFRDLDPSGYRFEARLKAFVSIRTTLELGDAVNFKQVLLRRKEFEQFHKEAKRAFESRDYETAIDRLVGLVAAVPNKVILHANLARAYAGALAYADALAQADVAAEMDPKQFSNLRRELQRSMLPELGQKALYALDFETAAGHYEDLRTIDPEDVLAYRGLALSYGHLKQFKKALEAVNRALELDPSDAELTMIRETLEYNASVDEGQ